MVPSLRSRLFAGFETLIVFGVAAAGFRWMAGIDAFKMRGSIFGGFVLWPYLALWLFTPIVLILTRRNLAGFGLSAQQIQYHLKIASTAFVPFFILSVALNWFNWKSWTGAALIALMEVGLLAVTALLLRKYPDREVLPALAAGLLLAPLAAGNVNKALVTLFYAYLLVAPAEEMLFRGYIQSRLNLAFGRPFCTLGIRWGWGLCGAALLFGLWHLAAVPQLVWPQALWTGFLGLMLGIVREKSGSVLAPSLLHGVVNYGPQAFLYRLFF